MIELKSRHHEAKKTAQLVKEIQSAMAVDQHLAQLDSCCSALY